MKNIKRKKISLASREHHVRLSSWGDYYTLGIFCGLSGLTDYAKSKLPYIVTDKERSRLFNNGINDSENYSFSDIAHEIRVLRSQSEEGFDILIFNYCGQKVYSEIMSQIRVCE